MAQRQVIKAEAQLFPHPNAERLALCKVGPFQLVVQKGNFKDGDLIVVAPERALLPPQFAGLYTNADTGVSYLHGPDANRVVSMRLRGERSQGVILPPDMLESLGLADLPIGEDLSEGLGITFYEPPVPVSMAGDAENVSGVLGGGYRHHDVEQFGIYERDFVPGEPVVVTEKLHGSQGIYYRAAGGEWVVTSKGLSRQALGLKENAGNVYWQAAHAAGLFAAVDAAYPLGQEVQSTEIQVFTEVLPVQKGYGYGQSGPTLRVFRVVVDGKDQTFTDFGGWFRDWAVPLLYAGPFDTALIRTLKDGPETVSGHSLHTREGVVVSPAAARYASDGTSLRVKLISDAYAKKETGDELS
ncbi:RNA ligase (ATP) [Deinococcus sp. QL22]|uniref:RNA ligase (ATP) n=1 Tax=Deinococcus sp. QL22 TaxID=2939437 RepID=UPI002017A653|nr:RNA ligase (ATP) [Deinococcus sp. QL22]UQN05951.1 RNA ligase (ATP) [Deinococcus sp. QL22]